ncbi:MAG TPA: 23S rRNA (uracil(1939)-C(5))-methyltransferase RlmD [Terriglobia bacterium]|nr:23S rRNA (uracil(1939)-C(5))-methyltransferase RlmD [Terriglobia bacterium]
MSFEVQIEKLIYGGGALAHHHGKPVFVSQTLPGERLEAEPTHTLKGILHARPVRILTASTDRVDPPCPYFGRCGGCQYQHIAPPSQTVHKVTILRETLSRVGKISWPSEIIAHSGPAWGYRNQAQFKLALEADGKRTLGFFAASSHHIVPVGTCNIIAPSLGMVLGELQTWMKENAGRGIGTGMEGCREIDLMADHTDENVMMTLRGEVDPANCKDLADTLFNLLPQVKTVAIESQVPGQEFQVFGQPSLNYQAGDFNYRVSPGSFFQTSRFLIPQLVHSASSIPVQSDSPNGVPQRKLALDLYAGAGLFALPLARQFQQVIAVESNPSSAADLAANASRSQPGRIRAVHQPVCDFLKHSHKSEPDLVVLDPPRAGVGLPTLRLLANLCPRRIHYVSCHPPTLARDLAFLLAARYRIESIQMFDFFPQTYHIECLVTLTR